jgi:hypothetical protein
VSGRRFQSCTGEKGGSDLAEFEPPALLAATVADALSDATRAIDGSRRSVTGHEAARLPTREALVDDSG